MKNQPYVMVALIILLVTGFLVAPGSCANALTGYSYDKTHNIIGSQDGALQYYQTEFIVHRGPGNDSERDVFLNDHSSSWPYDIRFTDANDNLYPYWIESYDGNSAAIWVNVSNISAGPAVSQMKIYYGKSGDKGESNGDATFTFFDDFNDNSTDPGKWAGVISSGGRANVLGADGQLQASGDGSNKAQLRSLRSYSEPYTLEVKVKNINALSIVSHWTSGTLDANNDPSLGYQLCYASWVTDNNIFLAKRQPLLNAPKTTLAQYFVKLDQDWHDYVLSSGNDGIDVYFDGNEVLSSKDTTYKSGYVGLGTATQFNGISAYYDDLRIRSYTPNEPLHGAWGEEQKHGGTSFCPGVLGIALLPFLFVAMRRLR